VQKMFSRGAYFPLPHGPRVSVVVAGYNGERTLKACLDSLERLNYRIRGDPGGRRLDRHDAADRPRASKVPTFATRRTSAFPSRATRVSPPRRGRWVAFTDSDCRRTRTGCTIWLGSLLESGFAGVGGPNFLPPEDSLVAAAVMHRQGTGARDV